MKLNMIDQDQLLHNVCRRVEPGGYLYLIGQQHICQSNTENYSGKGPGAGAGPRKCN